MKTKLEKDKVTAERDAIQAELQLWESKLEEAKKQVAYWKNQADAISVIGMRLLIDSWQK